MMKDFRGSVVMASPHGSDSCHPDVAKVEKAMCAETWPVQPALRVWQVWGPEAGSFGAAIAVQGRLLASLRENVTCYLCFIAQGLVR